MVSPASTASCRCSGCYSGTEGGRWKAVAAPGSHASSPESLVRLVEIYELVRGWPPARYEKASAKSVPCKRSCQTGQKTKSEPRE